MELKSPNPLIIAYDAQNFQGRTEHRVPITDAANGLATYNANGCALKGEEKEIKTLRVDSHDGFSLAQAISSEIKNDRAHDILVLHTIDKADEFSGFRKRHSKPNLQRHARHENELASLRRAGHNIAHAEIVYNPDPEVGIDFTGNSNLLKATNSTNLPPQVNYNAQFWHDRHSRIIDLIKHFDQLVVTRSGA